MADLFYVYAYLDAEGKPFYIGKGIRGRAQLHLKACHNKHQQAYGTMFYRKLRKLDRAGETPNIEKIINEVSESEALQWEQFFIAALGRRDLKTGCLCNHTNGGEGTSGFRFSEESKQKMSESRRKWKLSPESIEKSARSRRGQKRLPETCRRISEALKNPSRETLARMSRAQSVPVIAVDPLNGEDLIQFDSALAASKFFGVSNGVIIECLQGHTETSGGCGWRRVDETQKYAEHVPSDARRWANHSQKKSVVAQDKTTNEDLMLFSSVSEAARFFGVSVVAISNCLKGHAKTSAGCAWRYNHVRSSHRDDVVDC